MRMRKKKNGRARLDACAELLLPGELLSERDISSVFGNNNPLHIEIGCGKGDFICTTAAQNPDINFVAVERITDVMVCCAEKVKNSALTNIRVLCADARTLPEHFAPGSVERIYLNFSDPWTKNGYRKRRLTYRDFLAVYKQLLVPTGAVFLKTDSDILFESSLAEFAICGFICRNITRDLHSSEYAENNVMTEYERGFVLRGIAVKRVEAYLA